MMMADPFEQTQRFVRDIKGPAASILLVLLMSGRSLTQAQLEEATGYSDKPVRQGIDRLTDYGLLQNNGRYDGWCISPQLPLPFKELWQGHHGKFLEDGDDAQTGQTQESAYSPATETQDAPPAGAGSQDTLPSVGTQTSTRPRSEIPISEIGISDLGLSHARVDHDCLIDCDLNTHVDQSINQSSNEEPGNSDQLAALMRHLGIHGRVFAEFQQQQLPPAHLLAWHWWTLCQPWLTRNPLGYAIKLLRQGQLPDPAWLGLVAWWQGLDADDRALALLHVTGHENGRRWHEPAKGGTDLAYWLRDDLEPLPGTAVLEALVQLSRHAPQELSL